MCTRQYAISNCYGSDGTGAAAINARLSIQNLIAYDFGFQRKKSFFERLQVGSTFGINTNLSRYTLTDLFDRFRTCLFLFYFKSLPQISFYHTGKLFFKRSIFCRRCPIPGGYTCFISKFIDRINNGLHLLMAIRNSPQHDFFRQLHGFRFDHQNGLLRTSHH